MKTAFVQSAFYAGYFIVAIPASLFIKKTSYKIGIMTGLAFFALGCSSSSWTVSPPATRSRRSARLAC